MAKRSPKKVLESLSPEEAQTILLQLADEDRALASRAAELSLALAADVDADAVAEGVVSTLEDLEVEDVWDSSGRTRHGYVDPNELAWDMLGRAVEPDREELRRLHKLGRHAAAREFCVGLLRGLWRYDQEGTEFNDWSGDAAEDAFGEVLEEWRGWYKGPEERSAMDELVRKEFPEWAPEDTRRQRG